jgi:xylan 1,4-beta-xylosidase
MVTNPVLRGFHPDPSMIQVDGVYYIATSTFEYYPGVDIARSTDLAHWEALPSPLAETRLLDMRGDAASGGIWAPCLSYAGGLFWLIYTNMQTMSSNGVPWKDQPNYLTTAPDITGPWSDPVFLNASGFDPSLFHDDDGRHWLVNMEYDHRKTGAGHFAGVLLQEYSPGEKRLIGAVQRIFGNSQIEKTEGPHLLKRQGWYYLTLAEGGTGWSHAASVARSRHIQGPYELHPENPLLTSVGWPQAPLEKAGHCSIADSPDGKRSYMAFLCTRSLPGTHSAILGRETAIAEIEWRNDWPYIRYGGGSSDEKPLASPYGNTLPNYPPASFDPPVGVPLGEGADEWLTTDFSRNFLTPEWKTLRSPALVEQYDFSSRPGFLRLQGRQSPASLFNQTILLRRQTAFSFEAETVVEFEPKAYQEAAGLVWRYSERNQYLLLISWDETRGKSLSVQSFIGERYECSGLAALPDAASRPGAAGIYLGLTVREREGFFRYSLDGKSWSILRPPLDATALTSGGGFTGAFTGIFCMDVASYQAAADFKWFKYRNLNS